MPGQFTEDNFINCYLSNAENFEYFSDKISVQQFKMKMGTPDVLVVNKDHAAHVKVAFKDSTDIRLTNNFARIIGSLNADSFISEDQVRLTSGISPSVFRSAMVKLIGWSVVEANSSNHLKLQKNFDLNYVELSALEFKLYDWRTALRQSIRNRSFATVSSVIMPLHRKNILLANSHVFTKFGVGAAIYDHENNIFEYIVKPARQDPLSRSIYFDAIARLAYSLKSLSW